MSGGYRFLLSAALALCGSLAHASDTVAVDRACIDSSTTFFKRRADLPRPVLNLINKYGPMADAGEPFEISDAHVADEPVLPSQRFISARQSGCDLTINYEFGGRAHGFGYILLHQIGSDWTVLPGSNYPYSRLERSPDPNDPPSPSDSAGPPRD
jgi:hypothetical protein